MLENTDSEFAYGEKVKIINGLYKGKYGRFIRLEKDKYIIEIKLNEQLEEVSCKKMQLVKQKTWFGR